MAAKHSSKTKLAVVTPTAATIERLDARDRRDIEMAVHGMHAMHRLAVRAINEMRGDCGDADSYVVAIRDLCWSYGKRLDDCYSRLEGALTVGCFDENEEAAND